MSPTFWGRGALDRCLPLPDLFASMLTLPPPLHPCRWPLASGFWPRALAFRYHDIHQRLPALEQRVAELVGVKPGYIQQQKLGQVRRRPPAPACARWELLVLLLPLLRVGPDSGATRGRASTRPLASSFVAPPPLGPR